MKLIVFFLSSYIHHLIFTYMQISCSLLPELSKHTYRVDLGCSLEHCILKVIQQLEVTHTEFL